MEQRAVYCTAHCLLTAPAHITIWQWSEERVAVLQVVPAPGMDTPFCRPCQSPLTGASNSRPSGAPRAAPPGFERQASEVESMPLSCLLETRSSGITCLYQLCIALHMPTAESRTSATWQWTEKVVAVLQVAPATSTASTATPASQPAPMGASNGRPSGAPRAAPPGFERQAAEVRSAPC